MASSNQKFDKTTVLDSCVDGDESRFDNLIGKHYNEFNLIYDVIKQNEGLLLEDGIKCSYINDTTIEAIIPMIDESCRSKIMKPLSEYVTSAITGGNLVLNITVKKEW